MICSMRSPGRMPTKTFFVSGSGGWQEPVEDLLRCHGRVEAERAGVDLVIDPLGDREVAEGERFEEQALVLELATDLAHVLTSVHLELDRDRAVARGLVQPITEALAHDPRDHRHAHELGVRACQVERGVLEAWPGEQDATHEHDHHQQGEEHETSPGSSPRRPLQSPHTRATDAALSVAVGDGHGLGELGVATGPGHATGSAVSAPRRWASSADWRIAVAASLSIRARQPRRRALEGGPPARPRPGRPMRASALTLV